jgi:hypothetical protein
VPALTSAQAPRAIAAGNTVLFAAYNCATDELARADALVAEVLAPVLNKHVASGKLLNWGYVGVYIGNHNNRSIYVWATDPVALVQACVPNSRAWAELTVASSGLNSMPGTGRWLISGEVADASATASSNPMRMCVSNCDIQFL